MRRLGTLSLGLFFSSTVLVLAATGFDHFFPSNLNRLEQTSTNIFDRNSLVLREFTSSDGYWRYPISADVINPELANLVIAAEDKRFYYHPGVDPLAMGRALGQWITTGRVVSGGSTITMQLARLLEPRPRNLSGKIWQVARALQLEWHLSKAEILSAYLTLAPYGGNIEGVVAASRFYWDLEVSQLSLADKVLLAALPKNPEKYRPDRNPQLAKTARNRLLHRLIANDVVARDQAQYLFDAAVPSKRRAALRHAFHLTARTDKDQPNTTIDLKSQILLERLVGQKAETLEKGAAVAAILVDISNGEVIAHVGQMLAAKSDKSSQTPLGWQDISVAKRSPGSTLKPLIYAAALNQGWLHPQTLVPDRATIFGDYAPKNFSGDFHGWVKVEEALQWSLNVPAAMVLQHLGPQTLIENFQHLGIKPAMPRALATPGLPLALGGLGLSLEDLAQIYLQLVPGDQVPQLHHQKTATLTTVPNPLSEATRWQITQILAQAPLPPGLAAAENLTSGIPIAFKTGTSHGFRDAWAVGYGRKYLAAVWIGRPDGGYGPNRVGRVAAAPLLFDLLRQFEPPFSWPKAPPGVLLVTGSQILPQSLKYLRPLGTSIAEKLVTTDPPKILFPSDGAAVEQTASGRLALKARGGKLPLTWLIDGEPLSSSPFRRESATLLPGAGMVTISLVDAEGRSDSSKIWVEP